MVEVSFIMVDVYSLYTAIVARPWLYALGFISSILHQIEELVESQFMAR